MKTEFCDIIVKREPERNGGQYIFFFRNVEYCPDGTPTVEYFTFADGHGTASLGYYWECKYVKYLTDEILEKVDRYRRYINSLPDFKYHKIRLYKRLRY